MLSTDTVGNLVARFTSHAYQLLRLARSCSVGVGAKCCGRYAWFQQINKGFLSPATAEIDIRLKVTKNIRNFNMKRSNVFSALCVTG